MRVGVISDTHDRLGSLEKAVRIFEQQQVELIIHCGDWVSPFTLEFFDSVSSEFRVPIKSVFGNNEGDIKRLLERNAALINPIEFPLKEVFELEIESRKAVVYHGQDPALTKALIRSRQYDVVFTGHTHRIRNKLHGKTLVLNPGTICFAADSQIIPEASVAVYDPKKHAAEIITFR